MIGAVRRWIELSVVVPAEAADAVAVRLVELGAPGTIEEEAGEGRTLLRAHFSESIEPDRLRRELREFLDGADRFFAGAASSTVNLTTIDEEDWAEGWKQSFPPLEIGRSLLVRPPWVEAESVGRHTIEIEPAMAFGTGQHGSTLGCLLALEELFAREGALSPVLDVGTGSGILAIAAAKLGAAEVVAIDDDPIAVDAARKSCERNGVPVSVLLGRIDTVEGPFRLILANLYANVLRESFPAFASKMTPGSHLVVAGLLDADREPVSAAASASGFERPEVRSIDGWTTIVLRSSAR
jgi:ribosomal protein L11 methyltransferase